MSASQETAKVGATLLGFFFAGALIPKNSPTGLGAESSKALATRPQPQQRQRQTSRERKRQRRGETNSRGLQRRHGWLGPAHCLGPRRMADQLEASRHFCQRAYRNVNTVHFPGQLACGIVPGRTNCAEFGHTPSTFYHKPKALTSLELQNSLLPCPSCPVFLPLGCGRGELDPPQGLSYLSLLGELGCTCCTQKGLGS